MSGVVNSAAYANGKRVGEVPIEEVSEVLKQADRFLWIGLHEPDEALLKQVQGEFGPRSLACRVVGGAPVGGATPPDAENGCRLMLRTAFAQKIGVSRSRDQSWRAHDDT